MDTVNIHKTIQPLYKLCRIFSIWPYKYAENYQIVHLSMPIKLMAHLVNLTVITYFCWSVYGRLQHVYENKFTVTTFTDIAFGAPLFLLVCLSLSLTNSKKYENLTTSFYRQLYIIDKQDLHLENFVHNALKKRFTREIMIYFTVNLTAQLIDCSLLTSMIGIIQVLYYVGNYLTHHLMIAVFLQIKFQAGILQKYFESVNLRLKNYVTSNERQLEITTEKDYFNEKAVYVRQLCLTHARLAGLIDIVNMMHGLQMILLICSIISMILNALYYGLITGLGEKYDGYKGNSEIAIACNQAFVAFLHFVLAIILAGECSSATKEALKTGSVANEMLLEVSMEANTNSLKLYRHQLKILIQQVYCRNVKFSADGLFDVDYSLVLTVVGAIASYFIILLQFK